MRGVSITVPFWTYCNNWEGWRDKVPDKMPAIKGPVYSSGIFEGYYTRIPWCGDNEPQTYKPGICSVTGVKFNEGISVVDNETNDTLFFATNDIYCNWLKGRKGGSQVAKPIRKKSSGDEALHGIYTEIFHKGALCCDFMHVGVDKPLKGNLDEDLGPSGKRWLEDKVRGAILCGAIGDAIGRQMEGRLPGTCAPATWYAPWHGWQSGPVGTITDDTQMTWWLAESLLTNGRLVPDDLAKRFTREHIRGIGQATRQFVGNYKDKKLPWYEAGVASSGNGAAMRASPVGIFFRNDFDELKLAAGMQAMVTHNDPMAIASSIVMAYAVAMLLRINVNQLSDLGQKTLFCRDLADAIAGIEGGGQYVTRKDGQPSTLASRIRDDIPRFLDEKQLPAQVQEEFWSGAYVLESLPFALYCFLFSPGHFDRVIYNAVNESVDSDTVAAMAGTFCGALNGLHRNMDRQYWQKVKTDSDRDLFAITDMKTDADYLGELEFREELTGLADRMLDNCWRDPKPE